MRTWLRVSVALGLAAMAIFVVVSWAYAVRHCTDGRVLAAADFRLPIFVCIQYAQ